MSPDNTPPAILKYSKVPKWQFIPTSGPVLFPADFNFFPPILISALGKSGFGPVVIARWLNAITRRRSVCLGDLPSAEGGGSTSGGISVQRAIYRYPPGARTRVETGSFIFDHP